MGVRELIFAVGDNEFCALIGSNLMEGIAGFGQTRSAALRALADELDIAGEQQRDRKAA